MTATRDDVLKIKHISVVFDGFKALTDVDINIRRHDIHFFIGPNGAGKTTLLDIICAKTKPTVGTIHFYPEKRDEIRLTGMKEYKIVNEGVGRKFQVPSVFVELTVMENMILSLKGHKGIWQSIFYHLSPEDEAQILEVLKKSVLKNERVFWQVRWPTVRSSGLKLPCSLCRNRRLLCWMSRQPVWENGRRLKPGIF